MRLHGSNGLGRTPDAPWAGDCSRLNPIVIVPGRSLSPAPGLGFGKPAPTPGQ